MLHFKTIKNEDCFIKVELIIAVEGIFYDSCNLGSKLFLKGGGEIKVKDNPSKVKSIIDFKIEGS